MSRSLGRALLERIWGRTRVYHVFSPDPSVALHAPDERIAVYDRTRRPPAEVRAEYRLHAGRINARVMLGRLDRGAVLLVMMERERMIAYGWLQAWAPLKREFWWLADDAIGLGPYWTHPAKRGQGVYGRMLARSLAECRIRGWDRLFIWARAENTPSIAGIERAGFRSLGLHRVRVSWFGLLRRHAAEGRA